MNSVSCIVFFLLGMVIIPLCGMDNPAIFLEEERQLFNKLWDESSIKAVAQIVENRIQSGMNLNQPIKGFSFSILFLSVDDDERLSTTKKLLKHGVDHKVTMLKSYSGIPTEIVITPLLEALDECAIKTVKILLKAGADPKFTQYMDRGSIMHCACWSAVREEPRHSIKKYVKGARLLLHYGADPNARDQLGQTPLFQCVFAGKKGLPMMRLLLLWGADIAIKDYKGNDVIAWAERHNSRTYQFLKDWQDGKIKFKKKKLR